jgi:thiol-disulfide isomerase/thioredoxin
MFAPLSVVLLSLLVSVQDAAPAADGVVDQLMQQWSAFMEEEAEAGRRVTRETATVWAASALSAVDVTGMSIDEIDELSWMLDLNPSAGEAVQAHLAALAQEQSPQGLRAESMMLQQAGEEISDEMLMSVLNHPSMATVIASGEALPVVGAVASTPFDVIKPRMKEVEALLSALAASGGAENAQSGAMLVMALCDERSDLDVQTRNALMDGAVASLLKAADGLSPEDSDQKERLTGMADYLAGPAARGTLMGGPAPDLEFIWMSDGGKEASLADFKGKVVVVDFWATWCGPCVGSFPDVKVLQERYKDHDVAIIGVTSVQGTHYGDDGPVDVEGKPAEEFALMQEYMGKMDMTWAVAFSKDEVFNPNFGVNGIPHVTIIDVDGTVVENGLHPSIDPEHKYEVIDGLLKKAGKSHPVSEEGDASGNHGHEHPDGHKHPSER